MHIIFHVFKVIEVVKIHFFAETDSSKNVSTKIFTVLTWLALYERSKIPQKHGRKYCGFSYEKCHFQVRKIENWFSVCLSHVEANKKYKAHISKYV